MSRDHATMPNEMHDVLVARWEGFKRLAKKLPDHHILAVELIRTLDDQTVAVFTTVRNGEPVRSVVVGDAHGRVDPSDCKPRATETSHAVAPMEMKLALDPPGADPASMALSGPPPHQPSRPGVVAVGAGLLGAAFDVGELVDTSS